MFVPPASLSGCSRNARLVVEAVHQSFISGPSTLDEGAKDVPPVGLADRLVAGVVRHVEHAVEIDLAVREELLRRILFHRVRVCVVVGQPTSGAARRASALC